MNSPICCISDEETREYQEKGLLFQSAVFSADEMIQLRHAAAEEFAITSPRKTVEENSGIVRAVHGGHLYDERLARLVRSPRLLLTARKLLGEDVYVYQFKINAKQAFKGEIWQWHQDFIFWHHEDGMPAPRATTVALFLDEVTEFNGPLILVPKGHLAGLIKVEPKKDDWKSSLAADLKYPLDPDTVRALARQNGMVAPKGAMGSLLWFDCNIPHGSPPNMSPFDRGLILITYNAASNALPIPSSRPEWLVERNPAPLSLGTEGSSTAILARRVNPQATRC